MLAKEVLLAAVESLLSGRELAVLDIAKQLREQITEADLAPLDDLPDELKVKIMQQFFDHVDAGTHKTSFDRRIVSQLLRRWYGIELNEPVLAPSATADQPGRAHALYRLALGDTTMIMYMSDLKADSARELVGILADRAVLTTETTSPPCEIAEFVPLWLQNRNGDPADYYLRGGLNSPHPLQDYFDQQLLAMKATLSVIPTHCSTEMAIVANGDALRFHRDRCVRQYQAIADGGLAPHAVRLVQDLTLCDWDMQPGTISGTAIDHPNGDRYLFVLRPSEVVSMFFSERPQLPGPMMMPYHCALPVFDYAASSTVGPAKGKRLSALTRGLAAEAEIAALTDKAIELRIDDVIDANETGRTYRSGIRVTRPAALPETLLVPEELLDGSAEGLSITRLSVRENAALFEAVLGDEQRDDLQFFRIEKQGEGFSNPNRVLPFITSAEDIFLINRSRYGPQRDVCFSVALDRTAHGEPWIQLFRVRHGDVVRVPRSVAPFLRLTPTDHLLHRSAHLDSFYPSTVQQARLATVIEIAIR